VLGSRLRGRHALFPPKGEEKEEVKQPARHASRKRTSQLELEPDPRADGRIRFSSTVAPHPGEFRVQSERFGANAMVAVEGELDIATLPALRDAVASIRDERTEHLVIDLRALAFLDSVSIEFLLRLKTELAETGASLVIVRGPRAVDRVFELMELGRVLALVDEPPAYVTPSGA
jgi:anti-sigma B factor antagonist